MIHLFTGSSTGYSLHPGFHVPALPRAWSLVFATPTHRERRVWAVRSFRGAGCRGAFSFTHSETDTASVITIDDAYQEAAVVSGVNAPTPSGDSDGSFPPATTMSGINHGTRGRHEFSD